MNTVNETEKEHLHTEEWSSLIQKKNTKVVKSEHLIEFPLEYISKIKMIKDIECK